MFRKRRSWNKMIRFFNNNRKEGRADFRILTTTDKLIIIAEDGKKKKILRLKYKGEIPTKVL